MGKLRQKSRFDSDSKASLFIFCVRDESRLEDCDYCRREAKILHLLAMLIIAIIISTVAIIKIATIMMVIMMRILTRRMITIKRLTKRMVRCNAVTAFYQ